MKQILITLAVCISISLTGCTNKKFDNAVEEGNSALASKEYSKAESNFRLALAEKNDKEIFKLNDQTSKLVEIQNLMKDNNYDKALAICKELEEAGFANDLIKSDVANIKKDIEKTKSKKDEFNNDRKAEDVKKKKNDTEENLIQKARNAVYKATGTSPKSVKFTYNEKSTLGTIFTNDMKNQYYVFSGMNIADETEWDSYTLVDKNTFEVFEMSPTGEIYSTSNNEDKSNTSSKGSSNTYKCPKYSDCKIDFVHGHDAEGNWTPEDENGERGYGVCGNCGECIVGNDSHVCNE